MAMAFCGDMTENEWPNLDQPKTRIALPKKLSFSSTFLVLDTDALHAASPMPWDHCIQIICITCIFAVFPDPVSENWCIIA
jgi:hypothetical protein